MFFLELSCFFDDPTDVGNLNSGSSVFSKPSFNILEGHHTQRIAIDKQIDRKIYKYMDIWDVVHSVVSDSLPSHGLQHARLPCPSLSPRTCSNSCPLLVMPSNHLILCHPLLLLPSIFPSIRVFSNELTLRIRWLKYWSFNFSISPSNEYSGLISFRID